MRLSSDPAARRRLGLLAGTAVLALAVGIAVGTDDEGSTPRPERRERAVRAAVDRLSLRQQVGQLTVSSFPGARPPAYIRRRLRAGETAGVILFGFNAGPPEQWRLSERNLACIWRGYRELAVERAVLAGVYLHRPAELAWYAGRRRRSA